MYLLLLKVAVASSRTSLQFFIIQHYPRGGYNLHNETFRLIFILGSFLLYMCLVAWRQVYFCLLLYLSTVRQEFVSFEYRPNCINPLPIKLSHFNFHPLEVVSR